MSTPRKPRRAGIGAAGALLGDETRLAVLLAIWEGHDLRADDNAVPFSQIFERVGHDDPGNLRYHLKKLDGVFVTKADDEDGDGGDELTLAGQRLVGALVAPKFQDVPFGRLGLAGFSLSAGAWLAALQFESTWGLVALFAVAFVPVGVTNIVAMTLMQRLVPPAMLGRVAAVLGSAGTAVMPLGALLGGVLGDLYGPVTVMYAGGFGFLWIVVYIGAIPSLRRMPAATAVEPEGDDEPDREPGPAPGHPANAD